MTEINCIQTFHQLLNNRIRQFTISEVTLQQALTGWIKTASSVALKNTLQRYFDHVKTHVQKLELFFEEESLQYVSLRSRVMEALVDDVNETLTNCTEASIRDAALIAGVQHINHMKIAAYGTATAFANTLAKPKTAYLFHEFEVNEKQIDDRLSQLAEHEINKKALLALSLER
jgi:ferritin-like metal-binding protein YciE